LLTTYGVSSKDDVPRVAYRAIRPSDWQQLQRFHDRLSGHSIALRFHGAKGSLTEPLAHKLTTLDGHDQAAVVATTVAEPHLIAGVARYARIDLASAEMAIIVEDTFQHFGIGTELLRRLAATARTNGIKTFLAEVLTGNSQILRMLRKLGPTTIRHDSGIEHITVALDQP
jgi:GNAT superfamily N-acetyltransferase